MELSDFAGFIGAPVIVGLVEVFKRSLGLPDRLAPVAAIVVGVALNVVIAIRTAQDPVLAALVGIAVGLTTVGLFSGVRSTVLGR